MSGRKRITDPRPRSEKDGEYFYNEILKKVEKEKGQYLRAEDGSLHLIIKKNNRVPLQYARDNLRLARFMLWACNVTSLSPAAQAAIQRLQTCAFFSAHNAKLRFLGALSEDHKRLYISIAQGKLLRITGDNIKEAKNGSNTDRLWVEHPNSESGLAFGYSQGHAASGLDQFERLLVETQSCAVPEMRWFVAMHEAFFPFVRDVSRARFLVVHMGGTQQGKTTGAQRFTQLLGLGEVKGDYSVAALSNEPDCGLLVLDNREQSNFTQPLIDFCLFLATGARRGRSTTEGKERPQPTTRPVGVITSIEGVWKPELEARCVAVKYEIQGEHTDRDDVEQDILRYRNEILSAMIPVFQMWLKIRGTKKLWTKYPRPSFGRHFDVLAELLSAYGIVSGKEDGWAERIVAEWQNCLNESAVQADDEDELESPIKLILYRDASPLSIFVDGQSGKLYLTECGALLAELRRMYYRDLTVPKNAAGLGRRLRSARFRSMKFLDCELAPHIPQLRRTPTKRPIGFFMADEPGN
jgi:hypothetical protein